MIGLPLGRKEFPESQRLIPFKVQECKTIEDIMHTINTIVIRPVIYPENDIKDLNATKHLGTATVLILKDLTTQDIRQGSDNRAPAYIQKILKQKDSIEVTELISLIKNSKYQKRLQNRIERTGKT